MAVRFHARDPVIDDERACHGIEPRLLLPVFHYRRHEGCRDVRDFPAGETAVARSLEELSRIFRLRRARPGKHRLGDSHDRRRDHHGVERFPRRAAQAGLRALVECGPESGGDEAVLQRQLVVAVPDPAVVVMQLVVELERPVLVLLCLRDDGNKQAADAEDGRQDRRCDEGATGTYAGKREALRSGRRAGSRVQAGRPRFGRPRVPARYGKGCRAKEARRAGPRDNRC